MSQIPKTTESSCLFFLLEKLKKQKTNALSCSPHVGLRVALLGVARSWRDGENPRHDGRVFRSERVVHFGHFGGGYGNALFGKGFGRVYFFVVEHKVANFTPVAP
jgi:hypothetical protein